MAVGNRIELALKSDLIYEKASGTATAITLSKVTLEDGNGKTFIATANNNGASTTINGKPLYKPNTTTAPSLTSGKAYTVWYDATGGCFFIKASAEGTAVAANVLAGQTFSNDNDTGLVGTMPNKGAVNQSLVINGTYTIPAGYHNGSGKVTQSIATKAAQTYTPGTVDQVISAGQYLSGAQTILGDANLVPENIPEDLSLFGIQGIRSLGKKFASGTVISAASNATKPGLIDVTALSFRPAYVFLWKTPIGTESYKDFITLFDIPKKYYPSDYYGSESMYVSSWGAKGFTSNKITSNGFSVEGTFYSAEYQWYAVSS